MKLNQNKDDKNMKCFRLTLSHFLFANCGRRANLQEDEIEVRVWPLLVSEEIGDSRDAADDVSAAVEVLRDVSDGPAVQGEGAEHAGRTATGLQWHEM